MDLAKLTVAARPRTPWEGVDLGFAMAREWFRMAKDVERLKGRGLAPVGDKLKSLSFRKDTRSGSAASDNKRNKKK